MRIDGMTTEQRLAMAALRHALGEPPSTWKLRREFMAREGLPVSANSADNRTALIRYALELLGERRVSTGPVKLEYIGENSRRRA